MPRTKIPHAEKVSVLKAELRRLRATEVPPLAKMKKPEVVAELEVRKQKKRDVAVTGLRKVEAEAKERNVKTKKDADEVKGAMDFIKDTVVLNDMVDKLNTPKKRQVKAEKKTVAL